MEGVIINYDTCVEESVPREYFGVVVVDWTPMVVTEHIGGW